MKKIIITFVCSVVLASLFVICKYTWFEKAMANANYGMRAVYNADNISDLFIGSSMFRQGINAGELGESNFQLSYNGNQPVYEAMELRRLIDKGAKIKRVVIDMYAYSAISDIGVSDTRLLMDGDIAFTFSIYRKLRESGDGYGIGSLYRMVVQENNEMFLTWPVSFPLINARSCRGSITAENTGATAAELESLENKEFETADLSVDQIGGIEGIIGLCRENGIELLFLETPKYAKVYETPMYADIMRKYVSLLGGYDVNVIMSQRTYDEVGGGLTGSDKIRTYEYDYERPEYFIDLLHISSDGRKQFSSVLAPMLAI